MHILCPWPYLFLYFVSQCIHVLSHPTWARFLFRNLFMETYFCSFLIKKSFNNLLCSAAHVIAFDASFTHMCWQMVPPTASMLCLLSLPPLESASSKSHLHSKQSSKGPSQENFVTIGGCFECYMYHVAALGCLKKERRRWTILTFDSFRFATLK